MFIELNEKIKADDKILNEIFARMKPSILHLMKDLSQIQSQYPDNPIEFSQAITHSLVCLIGIIAGENATDTSIHIASLIAQENRKSVNSIQEFKDIQESLSIKTAQKMQENDEKKNT